MKKQRLWILSIPALALMAVFCAVGPASAATHGPAAARSGSTAASTTAVTPATTFLSGAAYARATAYAPLTACGTECYQEAVSPRIGCGGANGQIQWFTGAMGDVQTWGEAWDTCGSGTYVQIFLSWNDPFGHNIEVATAGPDSTVDFNTGDIGTNLDPSDITITACESQDNIWSCGAGVRV